MFDEYELGCYNRAMVTVLIIDDDDIVRSRIAFILKSKGYSVIEGRDGTDCLRMISESKIDVVIMDLLMPRMNGIQALEQIRAKKEYQTLPIFVYSADLEESNQELVYDLASEVMESPLDIARLVDMVAFYIK